MPKKNNTSSSKKPDYEVFQVLQTSGEKNYWNRIGAGWSHEDGEGLSISLNVLPLDGRLVIRPLNS